MREAPAYAARGLATTRWRLAQAGSPVHVREEKATVAEVLDVPAATPGRRADRRAILVRARRTHWVQVRCCAADGAEAVRVRIDRGQLRVVVRIRMRALRVRGAGVVVVVHAAVLRRAVRALVIQPQRVTDLLTDDVLHFGSVVVLVGGAPEVVVVVLHHALDDVLAPRDPDLGQAEPATVAVRRAADLDTPARRPAGLGLRATRNLRRVQDVRLRPVVRRGHEHVVPESRDVVAEI